MHLFDRYLLCPGTRNTAMIKIHKSLFHPSRERQTVNKQVVKIYNMSDGVSVIEKNTSGIGDRECWGGGCNFQLGGQGRLTN